MKKFSSIVYFSLAAFFTFALCGLAYADAVATVQAVQGEVFVQPSGAASSAWTPVTQNTPVNNGDSVKTGTGSCDLAYTNQAIFHMEANTDITIDQKTDTQDIKLKGGLLKGKVIKANVTRPFQVVTPTAVGAVRGTNVDFGFNAQGELTVDLHNDGPVQVYNDQAGMDLELKEGNKITVKYNKDTGELEIVNSCDSKGTVNFSILGKEYAVDACKSQTVKTEAASGHNTPPDTHDDHHDELTPDPNNPPDNPPGPSSPTGEDQGQNNQ